MYVVEIFECITLKSEKGAKKSQIKTC